MSELFYAKPIWMSVSADLTNCHKLPLSATFCHSLPLFTATFWCASSLNRFTHLLDNPCICLRYRKGYVALTGLMNLVWFYEGLKPLAIYFALSELDHSEVRVENIPNHYYRSTSFCRAIWSAYFATVSWISSRSSCNSSSAINASQSARDSCSASNWFVITFAGSGRRV